jgi:hypothetical protein
MLAHLKIILQFHAHPVHQKVSRFFGPRYIGDDFLLEPNLVSFNRAVVSLLELSFQHGRTYYRRIFFSTLCKHRFPCSTLTHSTNEDLLNIKRKGDRAESSLIQSSCRFFIGVIVPYEISKVNFRVETKILVKMCT